MNRLIMLLVLVALAVTALASSANASPSATCTPTDFYRDGINLTAAKIGGNVTGTLDAAGCDIGVYYGPDAVGSVSKATIKNARYFGVVNYRGKVDVKDSTISQIGNTPFDGTQHGVGVLYTTEEVPYGTTSGMATGTIMRNILSLYQKGGITVRGAGASAQIENNTLTGAGPTDKIAQNGIQVSFDSNATVKRNIVTGHNYTPAGTESCGLLFYDAASDAVGGTNKLSGNEVNLCTFHTSGVRCTPTGFYRDGINLTAARIGRDLTGNLDASGCDIGVFYGPGFKGSVKNATIKNARYFGVVNYRGNVDVTNSSISQIGNTPFDGTQHGVGILYTTEELPNGPTSGAAKGQISGNVLSLYQKGGITVRGAGSSARVENNKVTGAGPIDYIAQNGIQVSFGADATVKRNTVSGHDYTPEGVEACGLLFYQAASDAEKLNKLSSNELNVCVVPR